jgi:DNA-binding NarL/FixJ family response regulator
MEKAPRQEAVPRTSEEDRLPGTVMQKAELLLRLCMRVVCVGLDANAEAAIEEALVPRGNRVDKYLKVEDLLVAHLRGGAARERLVVAMDPWNRGGGVRGIRDIRTSLPKAPILVYTARAERVHILQALIAGADGYVVQGLPIEDLSRVLSEITMGRGSLCALSWATLVSVLRGVGTGACPAHLTAREHEVAACLLASLSLKQIASELGVAEGTVHTERAELYQKLGAHSRHQAVAAYLGLR